MADNYLTETPLSTRDKLWNATYERLKSAGVSNPRVMTDNIVGNSLSGGFGLLDLTPAFVGEELGTQTGKNIAEGNYGNAALSTGLLGLAAYPGARSIARDASKAYAQKTMPYRNITTNIESTSPNLLQNVENSPLGLQMSDERFNAALQGAREKGLLMADSPVTKTQGVWVDPESGIGEFNRVYAQNVGKLKSNKNIQGSEELKSYAESMGGDLEQWGVGANRFSPLPFGINKEAANSIKYNNVTNEQIIEAGKKINPKGGVVSATPDGGMVVFDPDGILSAKDINNIVGIKKPQYGLLDSAYFDTSKATQGEYMKDLDSLIKNMGY